MSETPLESPVEDLVEQRTGIGHDAPPVVLDDLSPEADPADVLDQATEVPAADDDEWR